MKFFAKRTRRMSTAKFLAVGYILVILAGSLLLALPFSSRSGEWTNYLDALFTSTSATCVTGLTVFDTYVQWSGFGQAVILILIQVGGIGFMTVITMFALFFGRKVGLYERKVLMAAAGNTQISGTVQLLKRIVIGTVIFEAIGTAALATRFVPEFGWGTGLYFSLFHSISAFCNAGFDLMGKLQPNSSLALFSGDVVVNLTVIFLIVMGGLGFLVWSDIVKCRFRFRKLSLHSRIVLASSLVLVVIPWALFLLFEWNAAFEGMNTGEKMLAALFHSVTPRTAGYFTVPPGDFSEAGSLLTVALMFIGGSPGSTAGGIKTTTFVVILLSGIAAARNNADITIGKRKLEPSVVRQAGAIMITYIFLISVATLAILAIDPALELTDVLLETTSAIGTVGLSTGITPHLAAASRVILILLMFAGRIGALSLASAFTEKRENPPISRPTEKIIIG